MLKDHLHTICSMHSNGVSITEIHRFLKQVDNKVSYYAVRRAIRKYSNGVITSKIKSTRRKLRRYSIDTIVVPRVLEMYKENSSISSTAVRHNLFKENIHLSISTIKRLRQQAGLRRTTTKYCHAIRDVNKVNRVKFCTEMLNSRESFNDWIFTDESTFQIDNSTKFCYVLPTDYYSRLKSRNKHAAKLHVWAGISKRGATGLVIFDGKDRMDSEYYCEILQDALVPFIQNNYGGYARLAQDNAPTHTSRFTTNWLITNEVDTVAWPPESPDLNPIELLWGNMKIHIRKQNVRTLCELREQLENYWKTVTPELCTKYIDGIAGKMERVLEQDGRNIFES